MCGWFPCNIYSTFEIENQTTCFIWHVDIQRHRSAYGNDIDDRIVPAINFRNNVFVA